MSVDENMDSEKAIAEAQKIIAAVEGLGHVTHDEAVLRGFDEKLQGLLSDIDPNVSSDMRLMVLMARQDVAIMLNGIKHNKAQA